MIGPVITRVGLAITANVGINTLGGLYSVPRATEKYYDMCGSLSFAVSAAAAVFATTGLDANQVHALHLMLAGTTSVWAARLFYFLTSRIHRFGIDKRFDAIKTDPRRFWRAWIVQMVWVGLVGLPTSVVAATQSHSLQPVSLLSLVGLGLWTIGFVFETVADAQKSAWQIRMGKERTGNFIHQGLWKYSRYPNYFGEITLWIDSYVMAVSAFPISFSTVIGFAASPAFVSLLLLRVSGIPMQEKQAEVRFRGNAAYAEYVKNTNVLFPWFPRKSSVKREE